MYNFSFAVDAFSFCIWKKKKNNNNYYLTVSEMFLLPDDAQLIVLSLCASPCR